MTQNGHSASAIVISCIDPRLVRNLPDAIRRAFGIDTYYSVSVKGGAKSVSEEDSREVVLANLQLAVDGGVHTVVVLTHADCAAYKAEGRHFLSGEEERAFHFGELQAAMAVVRRRFPAVEVLSGFVLLEPVSLHIERVGQSEVPRILTSV